MNGASHQTVIVRVWNEMCQCVKIYVYVYIRLLLVVCGYFVELRKLTINHTLVIKIF